MPDPTNLTSVKKSAVFRLKGLKDRLIYPNENFTPESSSEVNNMDFSERNIAATRRGKSKFNTTVIPSTEPVNGFGQFPFIAGSQKVFTTPDKVYTDKRTSQEACLSQGLSMIMFLWLSLTIKLFAPME